MKVNKKVNLVGRDAKGEILCSFKVFKGEELLVLKTSTRIKVITVELEKVNNDTKLARKGKKEH